MTSGPGATNALTGTMNAQFGGSAVLTITGEVPQAFLGRDYLQEGTDCGLSVRDMYAAATRYSADIADYSVAPIVIEQALRDMLGIPRRAVHLGISDNVAAAASAPTIAPRPPAHPGAYRSVLAGASAAGVRRILDVLSTAQRPLILLGNGFRTAARDASTAAALQNLAAYWQIPVMTTSDGKGVFPKTHALSLRAYGFASCECPCVDGPVGSRVNLQNLMAVRKQSCVRPFYVAASNIQTQLRHIVCRGHSRILLLVGSTDHHLLLCP